MLAWHAASSSTGRQGNLQGFLCVFQWRQAGTVQVLGSYLAGSTFPGTR